jgi:hypothetical protein
MQSFTDQFRRNGTGAFPILALRKDTVDETYPFTAESLLELMPAFVAAYPNESFADFRFILTSLDGSYEYFPELDAIGTDSIDIPTANLDDLMRKAMRTIWEGEGHRWDDLYEYPYNVYESDRIMERLRATAEKLYQLFSAKSS